MYLRLPGDLCNNWAVKQILSSFRCWPFFFISNDSFICPSDQKWIPISEPKLERGLGISDIILVDMNNPLLSFSSKNFSSSIRSPFFICFSNPFKSIISTSSSKLWFAISLSFISVKSFTLSSMGFHSVDRLALSFFSSWWFSNRAATPMTLILHHLLEKAWILCSFKYKNFNFEN